MKLFVEDGKVVLDFEGAEIDVDLPPGMMPTQALAQIDIVRHGNFLLPRRMFQESNQ